MPEEKCREFAELAAKAHAILKKIREITAHQLRALECENDEEFAHFDRELEKSMGEKERAIGALRQHAADHGCRPEFLLDNPE